MKQFLPLTDDDLYSRLYCDPYSSENLHMVAVDHLRIKSKSFSILNQIATNHFTENKTLEMIYEQYDDLDLLREILINRILEHPNCTEELFLKIKMEY